jgi:hypothetical protein
VPLRAKLMLFTGHRHGALRHPVPPEALLKPLRTHQNPHNLSEGIPTISRKTAFLTLLTYLHPTKLEHLSLATIPSLGRLCRVSSPRVFRSTPRRPHYISTKPKRDNRVNNILVRRSNGQALQDIIARGRTDRCLNTSCKPK